MQQADLDHFKRWFKRYVAQYHDLPEDGVKPIIMKEQHTMRTCTEIVQVGRKSGLSNEDLQLAETAALFHDIGRFPQWKHYGTFIDSGSADHALLGLNVVSRHKILAEIPQEEQELICEAIRHHNLRELPTNLSRRQSLFSGLLRDADKLDIWGLVISELEGHGNLLETLAGYIPISDSFSSDIVAELMEGKVPDFSSVRNRNDMILLRLGWVFDLNFAESCRLVRERNYVERLCDHLPVRRELREAKEYLISYVKNCAIDTS